MSSDFGKNKRRVDIKLNCDEGLKTYAEVINAIVYGETVIKCSRKVTREVYNNALTKKLNSIGINDIRFGEMTNWIGGGVGYVLYKERGFKTYSKKEA
jgi:hypothetical protein